MGLRGEILGSVYLSPVSYDSVLVSYDVDGCLSPPKKIFIQAVVLYSSLVFHRC